MRQFKGKSIPVRLLLELKLNRVKPLLLQQLNQLLLLHVLKLRQWYLRVWAVRAHNYYFSRHAGGITGGFIHIRAHPAA